MARRSRVTSTRARIKLRRILQATDNNVRQELRNAADLLEYEMMVRAPKDTGAMAAAITSFVAGGKTRFVAEVGFRGKKNPQRHKARFIEFGTKGHPGGEAAVTRQSGTQGRSQTTARGTANKTDGENFYGKYPAIPARPARPFIGPTWDARKDDVRQMIGQAINDAIKQAQQ